MSVWPDKTVMCTSIYIYKYMFELIKVHLRNQHRRKEGRAKTKPKMRVGKGEKVKDNK